MQELGNEAKELYSYNYKFPKLTFQNCNYNYIYYYRQYSNYVARCN